LKEEAVVGRRKGKKGGVRSWSVLVRTGGEGKPCVLRIHGEKSGLTEWEAFKNETQTRFFAPHSGQDLPDEEQKIQRPKTGRKPREGRCWSWWGKRRCDRATNFIKEKVRRTTVYRGLVHREEVRAKVRGETPGKSQSRGETGPLRKEERTVQGGMGKGGGGL